MVPVQTKEGEVNSIILINQDEEFSAHWQAKDLLRTT